MKNVQRLRRVVPHHAARMIEGGEGFELVGDAVAVAVDATDDPAAAFVLAEGPLFVDADKQFAARGNGQAGRVVHLRRLREERHLEAGGWLDSLENVIGRTPGRGGRTMRQTDEKREHDGREQSRIHTLLLRGTDPFV